MLCEIDFPDVDGGRWRAGFAHPHRVLLAHSKTEVAEVIAAAEQAARDGQWVVGFVAYEAASAFDAALETHQPVADLPLAAFAVYGHAEQPSHATPAADPGCGSWSMRDLQARIAAGISTARAAIDRGDYYQINYTTSLKSNFAGEIADLDTALRASQPNGYNARIDAGDWQVASVSPELFFDWTADRTLITRPMKGTAARDLTADMLRNSAKERAENLMIVDLLRNDMARVAETGSVKVTSLFDIESLPTVLQMTSTVRCLTRDDVTLPDVFRALFPCGSVTGTPKIAAMKAIAALESGPRGIYCGAIGIIRPGGHATFSVAIRTVVVDRRNGTANCGLGSGITLDSTPEGEYDEWLVKRRFLLRATASFELIETLRLEQGEYWLIDAHIRRLLGSAEHFGFRHDVDTVRQVLAANVEQFAHGTWRVRLMLSRDGRAKVESHVLESNAEPVRVVLAQTPIDSSDEWLRHKTTERSVYAPHVPVTESIFDTLMFNERDELTEFTRGNLVVEIDGKRFTPALSCGLLPGILRGELLRRGEVTERIVTRSELATATGIWFVNSVRGLLPVSLLPTKAGE
jgi:para-aminobenzoate synthetase/4-amino-4-deoxychorismate lyase